ncbi:MAG: hypothetical protein ACLFUG_00980 [Nitriliruptoraceae bacterium]
MPSPRINIPCLFMSLSVGILTLLALSQVSDGGSVILTTIPFLGLLSLTVRTSTAPVAGRGRTLRGLGAGLLTGLAGAYSLAELGLLPLSGPHWIYLPLLFATLGTILGLSAPVRSSAQPARELRGRQRLSQPPCLDQTA